MLVRTFVLQADAGGCMLVRTCVFQADAGGCMLVRTCVLQANAGGFMLVRTCVLQADGDYRVFKSMTYPDLPPLPTLSLHGPPIVQAGSCWAPWVR